MNSIKASVGGLFLGLLGGVVLGAGAAFLLAPQSGRRTRQKISDLEEDAEDYARDFVDKAGKELKRAERKGEAWIEKGREFVEEKRRQAAELAA